MVATIAIMYKDCKMSISVIIPAYNSAGTIKKCLDSISNQTSSSISEIIVVDDGSVDNTREVVFESCKSDSRIKYVFQKNTGVSAARNTGILSATGDYIMFVDSDDEIKSMFVDTLLNGVSNITLTVGGIELHQDHGISNISYSSLLSVEDTLRGYGERYPSVLLNGPCAKLYSADIIKKYNIRFDPNVSLGEDTLFVFEYLKHVKYVNFINVCGYIYYQLGTESLMLKYRDNAYNTAKEVYRRLVDTYISVCGELPPNFMRVYKNVLMVYIRKLIANRKKSTESVEDIILDYVNDSIVCDCIKEKASNTFVGRVLDWMTLKKYCFAMKFLLKLHVKLRGV